MKISSNFSDLPSQNIWKNLQKTWNIIFVILTCFHFMNFFGEKKSTRCLLKYKVADEKSSSKVAHFHLALWFKKTAHWISLHQKNRQMKAGQNYKYDITKTSGLLQVFPYILRREITKIWRNLHFYLKLLTLLRSVKKYWRFRFIFVTFSEYMNLLITHIWL